jgi:hypothetical protein
VLLGVVGQFFGETLQTIDGGYTPRFLSIFLALGSFRFGGESTLPPTAANADHWTAAGRGLRSSTHPQNVAVLEKIIQQLLPPNLYEFGGFVYIRESCLPAFFFIPHMTFFLKDLSQYKGMQGHARSMDTA